MRISRLLRLFVGVGLCLSLFAVAQADSSRRLPRHHAPAAPAIFIGARKIRVQALLDRGRVLVPVRGVFEGLGAAVSYTPPHFVVVRKDGLVLAALLLGRNHGIAGGRAVDLDAPPVRRGGRIYVPLRIVAEAAGATVAYTNHPPVVHIEQRPIAVATVAAPLATSGASADNATTAAPSATAHWRLGVAIVTGFCCLGCLVITARRFGPGLFRTPVPRAPIALEDDPRLHGLSPAQTVALSSVEARGEARFQKLLVRETRTIQVPVTREELVIEYAGEGGTVIIQGRELEPGEVVRIPLWEERVHVDVTKHVVRKEDIVIDKRRIGHPVPVPDAPSEGPRPQDDDAAEGSPS